MRPYKIVIETIRGLPYLRCADGPVEILFIDHDIDGVSEENLVVLEGKARVNTYYEHNNDSPNVAEIQETWNLFEKVEKFRNAKAEEES